MNNNISILVADDHPMLLKGITDELLNLDYVVYSATNGAQALEVIISKNPVIAFLDISMPFLTGFEVIKKCQLASLKTKFILLTSHKERGFVLKARQMKLSGYLVKDVPFAELIKCIKVVLNDGFFASEIFYEVFNIEIAPQIELIKCLSPSERTIVRLISGENSTKEIAEILSVSKRIIDKHRTNIIAKLELFSDSDSLSLWAIENKDLLVNI